MTIYSLDVLLFYLETVWCSMSSSNCCFLTCIQISQEAGQVVWCSQLFQNLPQFIVIYTVKGFGIVNKAEIDVFLELSCFFHDPADVGNLISGSSAFSKTSLNIWITQPEKEWNNAICNNMDGPRNYHTKWSKSERERQILYINAYIWNLEKARF